MSALVSVALLLGLGLALDDWRRGMSVTLAVGFLADPVRKLLPGEPVYLVAAVAAVAGATYVSARHNGGAQFSRSDLARVIRTSLALFVACVALATALSIVRYQNFMMAGIGVMSYVAPIVALSLGYQYGRSAHLTRRFLLTYVTMSALMLTGVYLSFAGVDWPVFRQVGSGLVIYGPHGVLPVHTGFFRSPEIAAWHAAAAACILIVLAAARVVTIPPAMMTLCMAFFVGAGLLTGRRKSVVLVLLFLVLFAMILTRFRHRRRYLTMTLLTTVVMALVAYQVLPSQNEGEFNIYVQRGSTVFSELGGRFMDLGLGSIQSAINRFGYLGGGVGVASQGTQYFVVGGNVLSGFAGEGGLGKVMAELGLPGLLLVLGLLALGVKTVWRRLAGQRRNDPGMMVAIGIVAFLTANAFNFFVASQAYGDPFVLLLCGLLGGFVVRLVEGEPAPVAFVPVHQPQMIRAFQ